MPFQLQRYLLSEGEHGLGYLAVRSMNDREFRENWIIHEALIAFFDEEARKETESRRAARNAIQMEQQGIEHVPGLLNGRAFDPATASPEEVEAWIASMDISNF